MKSLTIVLTGILLILALGSFDKPVRADINSWERGGAIFTFSSTALGTPTSDQSLDRLAATGANFVSFVPSWVSNTRNDTAIFPDPSITPTDAALIHAIQKAHSLGMKVMILPHLDPYDGAWAGAIDPSDINAWFVSYTNFILHYAQIAQANGVEQYGIGREFVLLTSSASNTPKWRKLLADVRAIFKGKITYQANWGSGFNEEFTKVTFWDDPNIDLVGISGFFPLSSPGTINPSINDMVAAWHPWIDKMAAFFNQVGKPIIFCEVGYRSIGGAASAPFDFDMGGSYNPQEQRDAYEAFFRAWQDVGWFKGGFLWNWQTNPNAGGEGDLDFTPQNKPAEMVMSNWYHGINSPLPTLAGDLALVARASASSENQDTQQSANKAIDGVVDGYPNDFTKEWATMHQGAGAWLRLDWGGPQTVNRIVLHDRINLTDQITTAHLTFSDGSVVSVGALPNNGDGLELKFADRTINSVMLTIDSATGDSTGLAEIEVYGPSAGNHPPTIISGPTAGQTVINPGQATTLSVTYSDPDGDFVTCNWAASAGMISGGGQNVTYTGPSSGTSKATITVTVSDAFGATKQASIIIIIKQPGRPILTSNSTNIDFGTVPIGITSIKKLTLKNVGDTAASISQVSASDNAFGVTSVAPMTIPANGQTDIIVSFSSQNTNSQLGQLSIASNAPDTPMLIVGLNGNGTTNTTNPTLTPPQLSTVAPDHVFTGVGDFDLTLNGRLFATGLQATAIINNIEQNIPTILLSDTQATVRVPAVARFSEGLFYIRVHNPGTSSSLTVMVFVSAGQPILNNITPSNVSAGAGDVPVALTGTFFASTARVVLKQGNTEVSVLTPDTKTRTSTHLDVVVPSSITGQNGTYTMFVRNLPDQNFDSAGFTFTVGQSTGPVAMKINFGSANLGLIPGYNGHDSGQVFSAARGFGWTTSMINSAIGPSNQISVSRTVVNLAAKKSGTTASNAISAGGSAYDGFIYSQLPATWFINLPNGVYDVEVGIGCPSKAQQAETVTVQGVVFFNQVPVAPHEVKSMKATVTVQNGKLSMTIGSGRGTTYVSFIKIIGH